jgi:hypothetical protein
MSVPDTTAPLIPARWACALRWALYFAVALASTWPLAKSLDTGLPLGLERVATVPLLNTWTIWWNADRAAHGFHHYWDAPIFHPTPTTFVFSEAQPTTLVVAPVVWLTGNAALAYNLYLLASLTLNGWCADRLLRRVGLGVIAAGCGGVMVQVLPFLCWQLGVLQLTTLWGVLWTTTAAWSFAQSPSWRGAGLLGLAFGVTYAACNYYGLFLAVVLGPSAVWMLHRGWLQPRVWLQTVLAAAVAGVLVSPIVLVQHRVSREMGWQRDWSVVRDLSAHLRDYTDTPCPQWLEAWEDDSEPRADSWPLGPGWLKLLAAAVGLGCGVARPSLRRWTVVAATMGALALAYSLGPVLELWNLTPYRVLFDYVPGFAQIRSPFRFAVFVQLATVWLAAIAVDTLCPPRWLWHERWQGWLATHSAWPRWGLRGVGWLPSLALGSCLLAETLPYVQDVRQLPPLSELPEWVTFLRDETPAEAAVVCLPFVRGTEVAKYEPTTWWMWWSTFHRHPLINGYSGFFPESVLVLQGELETFPDLGAPRLAQMGAKYAVVRRQAWTQAALARHPQTAQWVWLFSDERALIDIYEIRTPAP